MFYQIDEEKRIQYLIEMSANAGSKARRDAYQILKQKAFIPIEFDYCPSTCKLKWWERLVNYKNITNNFKYNSNNLLNKVFLMNNNDVLLLQFPPIIDYIDWEKCIKQIKQKKIKIVILVHDIEFLRYTESISQRIKRKFWKVLRIPKYNERSCLKYADALIVHNQKMRDALEIEGISSKDTQYLLNIFDYLTLRPDTEQNCINEVVIAGNLSLDKAGYLASLPSNVFFGLYGKGVENVKMPENIKYYGTFSPEDLCRHMIGKFGLVWDGDSSNTCSGDMGKYLQYNNPHKTSLYLACDIPVIVWDQAAIASFIIENKCGFVVASLADIRGSIDRMSESDYSEMKRNAAEVGKKIRDGYYLGTVMNAVKQEMEM